MNKPMDDDTLRFHLSRVSRSFAFCIGQLNEPLRTWVGLTYLVCRALDTIEDTPFSESKTQLGHFSVFDRFLKNPPKDEEIFRWVKQLPQNDMAAAERDLFSQMSALLQRLHEQPHPMRQIVFDMISSMSQGMQHFVRKRREGILRLENLHELNRYCFFVAGVVGESLAKLLALVEPEFKLEEEKVLTAHHFGLFLQKVNIIKDAPADRKLGRHFTTDESQLFKSIPENATQAMQFLSLIPIRQREFRLFCGWSLFLGLGTLAKLQNSTQKNNIQKKNSGDQKLQRKLSAVEAIEIIGAVEQSIDHPVQIRDHFVSWMRRLNLRVDENRPQAKIANGPSPVEIKAVGDVLELYHGLLKPQQLLQLGL